MDISKTACSLESQFGNTHVKAARLKSSFLRDSYTFIAGNLVRYFSVTADASRGQYGGHGIINPFLYQTERFMRRIGTAIAMNILLLQRFFNGIKILGR